MELTKGQSEVLCHLKDEKVNRVIWSATSVSGSTTGCVISLLTLANEKDKGLFFYVYKDFNSALENIRHNSIFLGIDVYFKNNNEVFLKNGSRIFFLSIDSDMCVFLDIFRADLICFDSMRSFRKTANHVIEKSLDNIKAKILIVTNPNNEYIIDKFHNRFLKNELLDNEKFVFSSIYDNPYLPKKYIDAIKTGIKDKELMGIWETEK